MEVKDLFAAIRRFWFLVVASVLAALLLGMAAAYLPKQRYESTATLIVSPASKQIDSTAVDTINFLLPTIATQVQTETFSNQVHQRIGATVDLSGTSLGSSSEPGTSVLHVRATAYRPVTAALLANAAAATLIANHVSPLVKIQLLDPARPAAVPFSPNRSLILFTALVVGLIIGVLAAIGTNAIRPRVSTAAEIRRRFQLEVIGEIPNVRRFPKTTSRLFDPATGNSDLAEAYQRLQTGFQTVIDGHTAVGITSCTAAEGKSAVASGLSWAIASVGTRVVAIDTDLRRPALHEYLGVRIDRGLADVPFGMNPHDLAQRTALPTLRAIAAGRPTQHPTSILHASYAAVLDSFDDSLIIVDMPPVLGAADAALVAMVTKVVVLVTDARHGDPEELEQTLHELRRAGCEVLGVVVNRANVKRSPRLEAYYLGAARAAQQLPQITPKPARPRVQQGRKS
ncbi:MAG: hypothetical protein C5B48_04770 [Candidatus Rokuibacteriota bacterium]|nr:MAG: hypothetical protein C5B48_04770 [Candidatus Rokubacteria bacterium]